MSAEGGNLDECVHCGGTGKVYGDNGEGPFSCYGCGATTGDEFFKEIISVCNMHIRRGLKKPDLLRQMWSALKNCEFS